MSEPDHVYLLLPAKIVKLREYERRERVCHDPIWRGRPQGNALPTETSDIEEDGWAERPMRSARERQHTARH